MLVSLRAYTAGGVLYQDVFTQYGPFYYELVGNVLRTIGHPVTMDDGRLFTLVVWTFTGLLMGLAVAQLTRRLALSIASQLLAFFALTAVTKEPLHPQGIIALLCAGMAAIAAAASRNRLRYTLGALGALAAAALLTKVNVGGLALLAIVFACVAAFSSGGALRSLACFGVGATPFLLIAPDLRHEASWRMQSWSRSDCSRWARRRAYPCRSRWSARRWSGSGSGWVRAPSARERLPCS